MTDPRLTLDDLCGVDGHPAARHDCRTADRALGILRCPQPDYDAPPDESGPGSRCGAVLHVVGAPVVLVALWRCERGHAVIPEELTQAEQEDDWHRTLARRALRPLPDSKRRRGTPLHGPLVVTGGGHYLAARFAVLLANIMIWLVNGAEKLVRRVGRDHELAVWVTGLTVLFVAAAGFSSAGLGVAWVGWCVAFMARGRYLSQQQRAPGRGKHRGDS